MDKKKQQLGMNPSTAQGRLRKEVLFSLVKKAGEDKCFQCGENIETIDEFSIEHKTPWLDSEDPKGLFFDLDNIAFSHLSCNCKAARKTNKKEEMPHGTSSGYDYWGCRCDECKQARKNRTPYDSTSRKEKYGRTGN